ncbi:hypothetical protein KRMM14A1259_45330 [Krasilnikovia sp. MM14-A1259]
MEAIGQPCALSAANPVIRSCNANGAAASALPSLSRPYVPVSATPTRDIASDMGMKRRETES